VLLAKGQFFPGISLNTIALVLKSVGEIAEDREKLYPVKRKSTEIDVNYVISVDRAANPTNPS